MAKRGSLSRGGCRPYWGGSGGTYNFATGIWNVGDRAGGGTLGSNWKEIWKADIEQLGLKARTSHVSARVRSCSSYVAGMPEMTNQFK